jgi:hypothetical protein
MDLTEHPTTKPMKNILYILILVLFIGGIFAYQMYTKEHTSVADTEAVAQTSADQLFNAFENRESEAMVAFGDKVLEISGAIYTIDLSNELEPQIVLQTNVDNGYIRCGFAADAKAQIESLSEGDTIKLKGICKGLNASEELDLLADKDVVMSNCIIID